MVNFISSVLQSYVWPPLVVMVSLLINVPVLRVGGEPGSLKVRSAIRGIYCDINSVSSIFLLFS